MKVQTVTIVGMDRIGASVGLALKAANSQLTLIGHDGDHGLAKAAEERLKAVDKAEWNLIKAVSRADILVLSLPVAELEETLNVIGPDLQEHTVVLDMAPLKQKGVEWAQQYLQQGHYVGVRPVLAVGWLTSEQTGLEGASSELFRNSIFCLMPSARVDPKAVETAVNFGRLLGATPYFVDPAEYDNLVQGVETMPGLLAAAMFSAVYQRAGWRDILRFAGAPFAVNTQPMEAEADIVHMAFNERQATLTWLDALITELKQVRQWLHDGDRDSLALMLEDLALKRAEWLHERAENNWSEVPQRDVYRPGVAEQLLGGLFRDRGRDE